MNYLCTYISGPISGRKNGNKEAFLETEDRIRGLKGLPVNPHKICSHLPEGSSWIMYMKVCIPAICHSDKIVMLPGWMFSRGARIEWIIANWLGIEIEYSKGKPCIIH